MTNPKISYGHGYLCDMDSATYWGAVANSGINNPTLTSDGDVVTLLGGLDSTDDEFAYWQKTLSPQLSTNLYRNFIIRWKTKYSTNSCGAKVVLNFNDATWQAILGATTPEFSTTWKVSTGTITINKAISNIQIYMDDYPNSINTGNDHTVYYDFILLCKGIFEFPYVSGEVEINFPNRDALIPISSRVGDITQPLGAPNATVRIWGDMDNRAGWKRSGDAIPGQVFYDIGLNAYKEPFQWLDTGVEKFKVRFENPIIRRPTREKKYRLYDFLFREKRLGCASSETYEERFGLI